MLTALGLNALQLHASGNPPRETTNVVAERIEIPGIHNAFRVTKNIYSGSQPEGEAAFAALAKLGVKTVVSVDGSLPEAERARQHGLRYIHLPFGYDTVPSNRVAELAKVAVELNGPFFVHCHHGLHRGPTAVAILCEASEGWTGHRAEAWMREAGTAEDYPGLYRAAREFKQPTKEQLAGITDLPETTRPTSLVEAMLAIDAHFERLKKSQQAGWKAPTGHADISPAHEATMLCEQLREVARAAEAAKRPDDYRATLAESARSANALREALRESADPAVAGEIFRQVAQSCAACHKRFRNQ